MNHTDLLTIALIKYASGYTDAAGALAGDAMLSDPDVQLLLAGKQAVDAPDKLTAIKGFLKSLGLGTLLGDFSGAYNGFQVARQMTAKKAPDGASAMDGLRRQLAAASLKSSATKETSILQELREFAEKLERGQQLAELRDANPGRIAASYDVLTGSSTALPKSLLGVAGGGLAGAAGGALISRLFTPSISDSDSVGEAKPIEAKRRRIAALGALLGAGGVAASTYGGDVVNAVRQKLAI